MNHHRHKRMPDEKFEYCSFSILGDITSQTFPVKKRMSHRIWIFTPRNGFHFKENEVLCTESFFSIRN